MKKMKLLALCVALLQLLLLLAACGGDPAVTTGASTTETPTVGTTAGKTEPSTTVPPVTEPGTTVPPVTEPGTTVPPVTEPGTTVPPVTEPGTTVPPITEPPVTEPPVVYDRLCLVENGVARYKLVNSTSATSAMNVMVREFNEKFARTTGVEMELSLDSIAPTDSREIIIGAWRNRKAVKTVAESVAYTEYGMATYGETIILAAYQPEHYEDLMKYVLRAMYEENGNWYLDTDMINYVEEYEEPIEIPRYSTELGRLEGGYVYFSMENTVAVTYQNTNRDEFNAYIDTLLADGFTKYTDNKIGEIEFATYTKDNLAAHLQFNPKKNTATLNLFRDQFLPPVEKPEFTKVTDASVNYLQRYGHDGWGLSMILQLSDGTYIIIDGGKSHATDRQNMIDFMLENKPDNHEKPIVSLWLLTHPHEDHVEMFAYDAGIFAQYVEVQMLGYNFPIEPCTDVDANGRYWNEYYHHAIDAKREEFFPNAITWTTHTGQKLYLADAEIDILYSHEDYYPGQIFSANDCNTNYRITVDGVSLMSLGDSDRGNREMVDMYGDALEADFIQTSHHGTNGPAEMYIAMDAKVIFWPDDADDIAERMTWSINAPWVNTPWTRVDADGKETSGDRIHYTASETSCVYFADYAKN